MHEKAASMALSNSFQGGLFTRGKRNYEEAQSFSLSSLMTVTPISIDFSHNESRDARPQGISKIHRDTSRLKNISP